MMNTWKILQNSWSLMLRYRALWIFGVILALTTISFGSGLWLRDSREQPNQPLTVWQISSKDRAWIKKNFGLELPLRYQLEIDDLSIYLDDPALTPQERTRLVNTIIGITAGVFLLFAAVLVLRYTSEVALIRMVSEKQVEGQAHTSRQGWSLGFSLTAVKLFLIDLIGYTLLFLLTILIFLPPMAPVLIAISGSPAGITIGVLLMLALMLVSLAALILMWTAGYVMLQMARRFCCLEGAGVFAAIWQGFRLLRTQLRGVGLTWLVITGLDLVYPLLAAPVGILLAAVGLAVSGLQALILGALLSLVLAKTTAWTIAVIVGFVLLALAVGVPMTLLGGLREVFKSSAWTLTFVEAAGQQSAEPAPAPGASLPQAGAA
jgi:hypothetical protein